MKKLKNLTLHLIEGQNREFWFGSICGQKIEQFQCKTCRTRIQVILTKSMYNTTSLWLAGFRQHMTCQYIQKPFRTKKSSTRASNQHKSSQQSSNNENRNVSPFQPLPQSHPLSERQNIETKIPISGRSVRSL